MAVDPSIDQINDFIADTGIGGFTHLTGNEADQLAGQYGVSSIPYFVFIDGDGGTDTMAGWSQGQAESKIDALRG